MRHLSKQAMSIASLFVAVTLLSACGGGNSDEAKQSTSTQSGPPPASPPANSAVITPPYFVVTSVFNHKCLEMETATSNVRMLSCNKEMNQTWRLEADGHIKSSASDKCLDAAAFDGNAYMSACHDGNNQKWDFTPNGEIKDRHHGQCLDLFAFNQDEGANVQMFSCNLGANQKWIATYSSSPITIASAFNNKCLDMELNTANAQMWTCNGGTNQTWHQDVNGHIKTSASDKCLDAAAPNGNAYMGVCHTGNNQKWDVLASGQIRDRQHGQCLDIFGFNAENGANVQMVDCNQQSNQRWSFRKAGLASKTSLSRGQEIRSNNGKFQAIFQEDGNFVLYDIQDPINPRVVWHAGTYNQNADTVIMQGDGNLVIYRGSTPLWNTGTNGQVGAHLVLLENGSLTIKSQDNQSILATLSQAQLSQPQVATIMLSEIDQKFSESDVSLLLTDIKASFVVDETESTNPNDPAQLFKIKGKLDWARDMALPNSTMLRTIRKNIAGLAQKLGAPSPIPLTITLSLKNAEFDLAVAYELANTFVKTGVIIPISETQFAFKKLTLELHTKKSLANANAPSISVAAVGEMFSQPTKYDQWLGVAPSVSIDNTGALTFGGRITGACQGEFPSVPTPTSTLANCDQEWDVMKLGQVRSTGGELSLTINEGVLTGINTTINNGRLGESNVEVDGTLVIDTDLSPGMGVSLTTKGAPNLQDVLKFYRKSSLSAEVGNQFGMVFSGMDRLPPNMPLNQRAKILITPTGLSTNGFNFPEPQIFIDLIAQGNGLTIQIKSELKGDVLAMIKYGPSQALTGGYMEVATTFSVNGTLVRGIASDQAKYIPDIGAVTSKAMDGITGVQTRATINVNSGAYAYLDTTLFGTKITTQMSLVDIFDQPSSAASIVTHVKSLVLVRENWLLAGIETLPGGADLVRPLREFIEKPYCLFGLIC